MIDKRIRRHAQVPMPRPGPIGISPEGFAELGSRYLLQETLGFQAEQGAHIESGG
ncbi:MAG: hypothetical protein Aurels2KO_21740 [Aureliella sp.]